MPRPSTTAEAKYDCINSDSEEDVPIIDGEVYAEVGLRYQEKHSEDIKRYNAFMSNPRYIMPSGNPDTNIVDMQCIVNNVVTSRCYQLPEDKLPRFFRFLERFRRARYVKSVYEKQGEYSGIMVDFDIYQEEKESRINDAVTGEIAKVLVQLIHKYLALDIEDSLDVYVAITRKSKPVYSSIKGCYKDGMHVLIPGIQITKATKKFLLKKCVELDVFRNAFRSFKPHNMTYTDFMDKASYYVPCFFLGSRTKPENDPYELFIVYKTTMYHDDVDCSPMFSTCPEFLSTETELVVCHELSLNWGNPKGIIVKKHYVVQDKYINELDTIVSSYSGIHEENELEALKRSDPDVEVLINLLDTLKPERSREYTPWLSVLCSLASKPEYKVLAEYFSKKAADKYNKVDFDRYWTMCVNSANAATNTSKRLTIASLYYWAKVDNADRFMEVLNNSLHNYIFKFVYSIQTEGDMRSFDVATIVYRLLKHMYVYDPTIATWYEFVTNTDAGNTNEEVFKWTPTPYAPTSLIIYISTVLSSIFKKVLEGINSICSQQDDDHLKYHLSIKNKFQVSCKHLRDNRFKTDVANECTRLFEIKNFSKKLDKDPHLLGVSNGLIYLQDNGIPLHINGYHNHLISQYTQVTYKEFDPFNRYTKDMMIALRNMFPDDEPDTFEFMMHYLASALDAKRKESLLVLLVGNGSNGKSILIELLKATLGDMYAVKMQIAFLTSRQKNPDNASPATMMLEGARVAYYSETESSEVLNTAKIKEITGGETLCGRKLYKNNVNIRINCIHLVTSNYDFIVPGVDYGIWRRIKRVEMKIKFYKKGADDTNEHNPLEKAADPRCERWSDDDNMKTAFLGLLCWYYHSLQSKYEGRVENVHHPHIRRDTERFRNTQDKLNTFINSFLVKTSPDIRTPLTIVIEKFNMWYTILYPTDRVHRSNLMQQFENSKLGKILQSDGSGCKYLQGYRVLDVNESIKEDESMVFSDEVAYSPINIIRETPDEYYQRICDEYKEYKHKLDTERQLNTMFTINEVAYDVPTTYHVTPASTKKDDVVQDDNIDYDDQGFPIRGHRMEGLNMDYISDTDDTD